MNICTPKIKLFIVVTLLSIISIFSYTQVEKDPANGLLYLCVAIFGGAVAGNGWLLVISGNLKTNWVPYIKGIDRNAIPEFVLNLIKATGNNNLVWTSDLTKEHRDLYKKYIQDNMWGITGYTANLDKDSFVFLFGNPNRYLDYDLYEETPFPRYIEAMVKNNRHPNITLIVYKREYGRKFSESIEINGSSLLPLFNVASKPQITTPLINNVEFLARGYDGDKAVNSSSCC